MSMDYLDELKKEYKELVSSITTKNTQDHKEIVRKIDINIDNQKRCLDSFDY